MSIPSWSAPGVTLDVLDGRQTAARETELVALHDEVVGQHDDADFARRLGVWRRQPGFALVEASHGGYLVGYACGMPLRPSTDWWRDLTAPLPGAITDEHPGRTFALTQLLVRGSWRRQGIAAAGRKPSTGRKPSARRKPAHPPSVSRASPSSAKSTPPAASNERVPGIALR